jgi:hypothetical protein
MRAVRQHQHEIGLGAQVDEIAGPLARGIPDEAAGRIDRDRAKKLTQGGMSRSPSPSLEAAARKFSWVLRETSP